ncbi:MAG: hypothetical protein MUP85_14310 [Candidatus Lokiarchaeota archaeon]|nr:hypothetical protein [Candidatus Lokiarchaeota archaeon]
MKNILIPIALFLIMPFFTNAQEDVNKIIKDITGKVDEIIIKSAGKNYVFTGEEAEKIFNMLKRSSGKNVMFIHKDDDEHGEKKAKRIKVHIDSDNDEDLIWIDENGERKILDDDDLFEFHEDDVVKDRKHKKVKVEIKDDSKKVTVTTIEDGKEKVEILEGEDAEKYIDKMKQDDKLIIKEEIRKDGKKQKKIIIEKQKDTN